MTKASLSTRPAVLTWDNVDVVLAGHVRIGIGQTYPLAHLGKAHRDLEALKTAGSTVLFP